MWKHSDPYSAMEAGDLNTDTAASFYDQQVRQGFMRKVFGIVSAQLALTTATCVLFMSSSGVKSYFAAGNTWPLWTSMVITFAVLISMMCKPELTRSFPHNYVLLALFTAAESVMIGAVCMFSPDPSTVAAAAGITAAIVFALTVYALQTKYDFTTAGGVLTGVLMGFLIMSFIGIFFPKVKLLQLVIAGAGAMIFAAFLVIDIQMLMDGKSVQISPDDYILGAINIYLDIINLFLYILRILNAINGNRD